jgi:AraC-like DNA-binding protein
MTETLFSFDRCNYQNCHSSFRGADKQEYYLGDYTIEPGPVIDVRAERRVVDSSSIIRLRSRSRQFFRRSWSHIRSDGKDVVVFWLVKRGSVTVTHSGGSETTSAGGMLITRSTTPFFMECVPDAAGQLEALHLVAPSCELHGVKLQNLRPGMSLGEPGRQSQLAEKILAELLEDPGDLPDHVARTLTNSALALLGNLLAGPADSRATPHSVPLRRLRDILRYIETHISNPTLKPDEVAQACGISSRYLHLLLKQSGGTSYSVLVWRKRLEMASQLLSQAPHARGDVASIAYRTGFKSPAHFSRMFRKIHHQSPREYRGALASAEPPKPGSLM